MMNLLTEVVNEWTEKIKKSWVSKTCDYVHDTVMVVNFQILSTFVVTKHAKQYLLIK